MIRGFECKKRSQVLTNIETFMLWLE